MNRGTPERCPFCAIVAGDAPAHIVAEWHGVIAIVPLNPVVPGHVIVLPTEHVDDFAEDPDVTASVMRCAAELGRPPANIITSAGLEATQTVRHLHIHVVPRRQGDGLALPWTDQPATAPTSTCPRCGSARWVSVSLDGGYTRKAQCVPCGAYHPGVIGHGWRSPRYNDTDPSGRAS